MPAHVSLYGLIDFNKGSSKIHNQSFEFWTPVKRNESSRGHGQRVFRQDCKRSLSRLRETEVSD